MPEASPTPDPVRRSPAPPRPFLANPTLSIALAALFACAVLLPLLGHRPLTDWDEGIYAEIAREMLAGHTLQSFLIPHWNGALWFEKPPLQMWLTAASLRLFGLNAFAARLPSALAGVATVAVLHAWLQRRAGQLTAWLGTVLLLSAYGFQHVARVGETDTLLSFFCLVAVLGLAELQAANAAGWLLFFAGFALALMTKGAASVTLPLTAAVFAVLHSRHLLRHPETFTAGLLVFLALTVPWHAYVYARFGHAFLADYVGFHTLTRATGAIEGHHTHPWFYLGVLLVSAPLFSLLYPWALAAPFRAKEPPAHPQGPNTPTPSAAPGLQAFAVFALVTLALFSAAQTRLPHYIAPAYPALSALTASLLAGWLLRRPQPLPNVLLRFGAAALAFYVVASLLTAGARRALHSAHFRAGYTTPDNRESVALLQQLTRTRATLPGGPLLVWHANPVVPLTTDAFYAHRLAEQVSMQPPPADLPRDPYFNNPQPLSNALGTPHLLLLDRSLLSQLPAGTAFVPLASGASQAVGILKSSELPAPPLPAHP